MYISRKIGNGVNPPRFDLKTSWSYQSTKPNASHHVDACFTPLRTSFLLRLQSLNVQPQDEMAMGMQLLWDMDACGFNTDFIF